MSSNPNPGTPGSEQKSTLADAPFDDPEADSILRSSDGVDFHVHTFFISLVSPVFRDMFTLPENPEEDSRKVVDLSETSHILYRLLPWCDPRASAKSTRHLDMSLSDISEVLRTTDKYQMDGLPRHISVQMWRHVEQEPVRVYATACRYTAAEWARIVPRDAAKQTLKGPITFTLA